jgi:CubicO group peptidase (beta-lactamase class C family)
MPAPAEGYCDKRSAAVREAFGGNFAERGELGAAVCVLVDGRVVADLWGWADQARQQRWQPDTREEVAGPLGADVHLGLPAKEHHRVAAFACTGPPGSASASSSPQPERPLGPGQAAFGHFGAGGSLGFCDPGPRLAFGYVMNQMGPRWQNPRTRALVDAVYACL